jgi:hypothetical protein
MADLDPAIRAADEELVAEDCGAEVGCPVASVEGVNTHDLEPYIKAPSCAGLPGGSEGGLLADISQLNAPA